MHIFFTVLVWIFAVLLALLVLFLLLPICVSVKLDYDKLTVHVHILFIKITLYPLKPPKQKTKQKLDKTLEDKPKADKAKTKAISLDKILGLVSTAKGAICIILKWLHIRHIEVVYPIHKDDPADTGIAYGQAQAYAGAAIATLRNALHLSFKKLDLIPDFNGEYKYMRYFYCNIWSTPIIMLVAAIYVIKRLFKENLL